MGVNATGTLGVAGRAPKMRESRRRILAATPARGSGEGHKIYDFFDLKIVSYGAFWVLFSRFMCPMDCSCMINFIEVPVCA